jgi:hypothetical protein
MNSCSQHLQSLRSAFEHPADGVVGLVNDLLKACGERGLYLDWHAERCRVRSLDAADALLDIPLRQSVFRSILARIAALCNERHPASVSPYGGQGECLGSDHPPSVFAARFVNTPSEQTLELIRKPSGEHMAATLNPAPNPMPVV